MGRRPHTGARSKGDNTLSKGAVVTLTETGAHRDCPTEPSPGADTFPGLALPLSKELKSVVIGFAYKFSLSARETQVLGLAAVGKSDKVIAAEMACAYRTVRSYWARICLKTNAPDRDVALAQLLTYASTREPGTLAEANDLGYAF